MNIKDKVKKLLIDSVDDLKRNDLDRVFYRLNSSYEDYEFDSDDLRLFLTGKGIDPLKYVTRIPLSYFANARFRSDLNLSLYSNIRTIECNAFYNCSVDNNIILPLSILVIESIAFFRTEADLLILPDRANTIELCSFTLCRFNKLQLPNSLKRLNPIFDACNIREFKMPDNLDEIDGTAFVGLRCQSIIYRGKEYLSSNTDNLYELLDQDGVNIV